MLELVHSSIKFAQLWDDFVYDFITTMNIYEGDVYHMFYGRQSSFEGNVLNNFIALINIACESINLCWITYLNTRIDHLACEFAKHHMRATF
jgi:hypothetical protein